MDFRKPLALLYLEFEEQQVIDREAAVQKVGAEAFSELAEAGLIYVEGKTLSLTDKGRTGAEEAIRLIRLGERLIADILEEGESLLPHGACGISLTVKKEFADHICTLLGHPRECPYGRPIPRGSCCIKGRDSLPAVIASLDKVYPGEEVTVLYILGGKRPRLEKLMSYGLTPGARITVRQRIPEVLIRLGETNLAVEREVARSIFVRR